MGWSRTAADLIGFLATDVVIKSEQSGFGKTRARADGGSTRWLHIEGRPAFIAKNRYGMPERIAIPQRFDFQARSESSSRSRRRAQPLLRHPKPNNGERDMSDDFELPETFDPGAHEGTGSRAASRSVGIRRRSSRAEVRDASNGNGTYLLAVFEILEGEHRGRKIFQNVTLQNASQQAVEIGARLLTDIYDAVGHTGPTRRYPRHAASSR